MKSGSWAVIAVVIIVTALSFPPSLFAGDYLGKTGEYLDKASDLTDTMLDYVEDVAEKAHLKSLKAWLNSGPVRVQPYLKSKLQWENNIFSEPNDAKDDIMWTVTPGVGIQLPYKDNYRLGLVYEADFEYYLKNAVPLNTQTQKAAAVLDVTYPPNWYFKLTESLDDQSARSGTAETERVDYIDNTATARAGYKYEEWRVEAGYTNFGREYRGDIADRFSYLENRINALVAREMPEIEWLATSEMFIEYTLNLFNYDEDPGDETRNGSASEWALGVRGNNLLGIEKLSGSAKGGWLQHHYEGNLGEREDSDPATVSAEVALSYQLFQPTRVSSGFIRRRPQSTFARTNFYDEKVLYTVLTHLFTPKIRGKASATLINRDYEQFSTVGGVTIFRDDDLLLTNVGIDYSLRPWLMVSAGYDFSRRNSNYSVFDYANHVASLSFTMPF